MRISLPIDRPQIAFLLLAIVFVLALNLTPIISTDYYLHLAIADVIWVTREIPNTILFAFTQAKDFPFVAHEWLSALALSGLTKLFGFQGMAIVKALFGLLIFALTMLLAMQISSNWAVSIAIGCCVSLTINFRMVMRPELFAYIFFLAQLNIIQRFMRTERLRWLAALLPIMTLWANCHGSFLVGLLLPPLFLGGSIGTDIFKKRLGDRGAATVRIKRIYIPLGIISLLSIVACLMNPLGLTMLTHSLELSESDYIRELVLEWFPTFHPFFVSVFPFKIYVAYWGLTLVALVLGWRKIDCTVLLLLAGFGYLSVDVNRHIAFFALAGTWWLALGYGEVLRGEKRQSNLSMVGCLILIGAVTILLTRGNVHHLTPGLDPQPRLPDGAIETIRQADIQGNVINSYAFGGPLAYYFYPQIRIGLDSRIDAYGNRYFWEYEYRLTGDIKALIEYMELNDVVALVLERRDFFKGDTIMMVEKVRHLRNAGYENVFDESGVIIFSRTKIVNF